MNDLRVDEDTTPPPNLPENPAVDSLDAYQEMLEKFKLPDNFAVNVRAQMDTGLNFFQAFNKSIFESLTDVGLLKNFDGKYDSEIRKLVRRFLDITQKSGKYFRRPNDHEFVTNLTIKRFISENKDTFLLSVQVLLDSLYRRHLDGIILDKVSRERDEVMASVESVVASAGTDGLMDIQNKTAYFSHLKYLMEKDPPVPLAMLVFDADHFKQVNDTYGHSSGDIILKAFAGVIKSGMREGAVFRYGGEEIVVVLELSNGLTEESIINRADQIREDFSRVRFNLRKLQDDTVEQVQKTCSVGIAFGSTSNLDEKGGKFFIMADSCMYVSKNTGRNKITIGRMSLNDA